jgi:inorganic pyrophosphatase
MSDALGFLGKIIHVIVDRPMNTKHSDFELVYSVNYGYVPDTVSTDGEELDAYILGVDEPVDRFTGKCIAVIHRKGDEDKLVVVPDGLWFSEQEIRDLTFFSEQYFTSSITMNR